MKSKTIRTILCLVIFLLFIFNLCPAQEIPNGDEDLLWKTNYVGQGNIGQIAIHPLNSNLLIGEYLENNIKPGNKIFEHDMESGNCLRTIICEDSTNRIKQIKITSDGNFIIVNLISLAYFSNSISKTQIIDYKTGKVIKNLKMYFEYFDIIPNSTEIMGFVDSLIIKYDFVNDSIINKISYYDLIGYKPMGVNSIVLSSDGTKFAFSFDSLAYHSFYGLVKIYDSKNFNSIQNVLGYLMNGSSFMQFSALDKLLLIQLSVGNRIIIDLNTKNYKYYSDLISFTKTENFWVLNSSGKTFFNEPWSDETRFIINKSGVPYFTKYNQMYLKVNDSIYFYSNRWYNVGVNEPKELQAAIYPNPASEYIEINIGANGRSPLQEDFGSEEIRIYDIFGKHVLSVETQCIASLQRIDVSALPTGIYFVRVGEKVEKFVKL